jgi:hypothetical protein
MHQKPLTCLLMSALITATYPQVCSWAGDGELASVTGQVKGSSGGPGGQTALALVRPGLDDLRLQPRLAELAEELQNLAGAKLLLRGLLTKSGEMPYFVVYAYTILEVSGGVKPRTGMLTAMKLQGSELLLFVDDSGEAHLLPEGWKRKLSHLKGARVWMIGDQAVNQFEPRRFAVIRVKRNP